MMPAVIAYMSRNTGERESLPAPRPWAVAAIQTGKFR